MQQPILVITPHPSSQQGEFEKMCAKMGFRRGMLAFNETNNEYCNPSIQLHWATFLGTDDETND